jgi:hypothetical protein
VSTTWIAAESESEHRLDEGVAHDYRPLRFERRNIDRWPLEGAATAFRLSGEHFGTMHELHVLDYSPDGLGAICDATIPPGTVVSVGFQAPGHYAKRGTVLRCAPCGQGYRVAIQFEPRLAA